jgi:hypothetical protein
MANSIPRSPQRGNQSKTDDSISSPDEGILRFENAELRNAALSNGIQM